MTVIQKNIQLSSRAIAILFAPVCIATPVQAQTPIKTVASDNCSDCERHFSTQLSAEGSKAFTFSSSLPLTEQTQTPSIHQNNAELKVLNAQQGSTQTFHSTHRSIAPDFSRLEKRNSFLTQSLDFSRGVILSTTELSQVPNLPPDVPPIPPPQNIVPLPNSTPLQPQTPLTPKPLPPPEELFPTTPTTPITPEVAPVTLPDKFTVERFEFIGNTAFSNRQLAEVTAKFTGRSLTFAELLEARSAVTKLYVDNGYVTSGALIPPQSLTGGVVTIQVVEGSLEAIQVNGTRRLNLNYVRSRLAIATPKPLNVPRLLEALRLLQLNPLIKNLSAELAAGSNSGSSLLTVKVQEANSFSAQTNLNNGRSPSVGSFRRGVQLTEANLLGLGDGLSVGYTNTDGSNALDISYTFPLNPRNGTLNLSYGNTSSHVIESPFELIDIESSSRYFDLTFRQPVIQTPSRELALGLTASRRESNTSLLNIPFPLSEGADEEGRTRVSALRFFQEWTQRGAQEVIAFRSQFNIGLGVLNATVNDKSPDSRFLSWRGQGQWVRLLAPDTVLLVRGDLQLADRSLLPIEQIGLGGFGSIRGYRQDLLLADNGALASAELRLPILRMRQWQGILHLIPFVDVGTAWNNNGTNPKPDTLASVGLGLQLALGNVLQARLDWGIPLISVDSRERTLQEKGLVFSIIVNPF
jgi:hemolysin activation/secretion protein